MTIISESNHPLDRKVSEYLVRREKCGKLGSRQTSFGYFCERYWHHRRTTSPRWSCEAALGEALDRAEGMDIKHYKQISRAYWRLIEGESYLQSQTDMASDMAVAQYREEVGEESYRDQTDNSWAGFDIFKYLTKQDMEEIEED